VALRTRALEVGSVADEQLHTLKMTILGCYHEWGLHAGTDKMGGDDARSV
jgi:hypothetical protein